MKNKIYSILFIALFFSHCAPLSFERKVQNQDAFAEFLDEEAVLIENEIAGKSIFILPVISNVAVSKEVLDDLNQTITLAMKNDTTIKKIIPQKASTTLLNSKQQFNLDRYLNTLRDVFISNLDLALPIANELDADYFLATIVNLYPISYGKMVLQMRLFDIKNNRLLWIALDNQETVTVEEAQGEIRQMSEKMIEVLINRYKQKNYKKRYNNLKSLS